QDHRSFGTVRRIYPNINFHYIRDELSYFKVSINNEPSLAFMVSQPSSALHLVSRKNLYSIKVSFNQLYKARSSLRRTTIYALIQLARKIPVMLKMPSNYKYNKSCDRELD